MFKQIIGLVLVFQCLYGLTIAQSTWGGITLKNNGGYKAKLVIVYKIGNDYQAVESDGFPVGQARNLPIPPEATNVLVQGYVDIFVNNWSVIFADSIGTPQFKCYSVWGTTLNPSWAPVDC